MQVIATIVYRQHSRRMFGVADASIEVNHGIERTAVADPRIYREANRLTRWGPGAHQECLVLERRQGAAEDPDAARVRPQRHLLQASEHLFGGYLLLGLRPTIAQVIGAEQHDHMRHARLCQHVAIEPAQAAVTTNVMQDAVAAETLVHHRHWPAAAARDQPACELIRPTAERV